MFNSLRSCNVYLLKMLTIFDEFAFRSGSNRLSISFHDSLSIQFNVIKMYFTFSNTEHDTKKIKLLKKFFCVKLLKM